MTDGTSHQLNGTYGTSVIHSGAALNSSMDASSLFVGSVVGANVAADTGTVTSNSAFSAATTNLTVEAWIKPASLNTTNNYIPIVSYGREVIGSAWSLRVTPQSSLNFYFKVNTPVGSYQVKTTPLLNPAVTYHVVATYNGSVASVYINGSLASSIPATGTLNYSGITPSYGLAVGGAMGGSLPTFDGAISDVAIYSTSLSASVVQNHYTTGYVASLAPTPPPAVATLTKLISSYNPVAFYRLNDTSTTMVDSGPSQLNGTYGATVGYGNGPSLTSAGDKSSIFNGAPAGSSITGNAGTVPTNPLFTTPTSSLTVEAWIKPTAYNTTNTYESIVSYGRQVIGSAWALEETPQSTLTFYLKVNGGSYLLKPTAGITPGQIYHVVATYTGSTLSLYVNGALAQSVPATGAINYAGITSQYGLGIGGGLGGTLPIFNGAINDVVVYASALTAADVQKHYLTGQIIAPTVEQPTRSDAFVDSIGVVTHLRTSGGPYTASFPTFESLIKASGIRHIGDSLIATPTWYPQEIQQLAADGIHASLITGLGQTPQQISSTIALFGTAVEAIEGPNEPDLSGDPNWIADTQAFQKMLYATVKGTPASASLPVVGPSITTVSNLTALGNLSAYMDNGSMHDYFSGYNPGTTGWGSLSQYGIYGSIPWSLNVNSLVSGSKPMISTETGYSNLQSNGGSVDAQTLARYIPRLYLEHFLHGVPRTTSYEFYDEPGTGNFANFGLVDANNNPKSSYYAIKSLIATLADPGSTFTTKTLTYFLTGNLNNVQHLLLQKRDGTYQLVLWVEVPSYDPNAKTDLVVPSQTITLQPTNQPSVASVATIGDTGTLTSKSLSFPSGVASITIDDHVTIVSFK